MKFSFLALVLFSLVGCSGGGGGGGGSPSTPAEPLPEWTIFVYGNADNNLSVSMLRDFVEMTNATFGQSIKVIAALDFDSSRNLPGSSDKFPSGTGIFQVLGSGNFTEIETKSEENFDDPSVLTAHVVNAFSKFPSKKRGVILWNHGGSWDGGFGSDVQNGTSSHPTPMSITQIRSALSDAALQLNLGSKPFDFLSFDTCLMSNIESVYEFRNLAKYYFASAEIDFGNGWDYANALSVFGANPEKSIDQLSSQIVQTWDNHHKNAGPADKYLRTQTAIDTGSLESLSTEMGTFVNTLVQGGVSLIDFAKRISRASPGFGASLDSNFGAAPSNYRDMGHFLSMLTNTSDASTNAQATTLRSNISGIIKAQSLGDTRVGNQFGLSLEASIGNAWSSSKKTKYSSLGWNIATSWSNVLDYLKIAHDSDSGPPTLSTSGANTSNPDASNKPTISFTTSNTDVDRAMVYLFAVSGSDLLNLGFVGHGFVENSTSYQFQWGGKYFRLSNGTTTSAAALGVLSLPGKTSAGSSIGGFFQVRGYITDGTNSYDCYLVGSGSEPTLNEIMLFIPTSTGVTQSTMSVERLAGVGLSFVPVLEKIPSSGPNVYIPQTSIPLTSGLTGLSISTQSSPAGNYALATMLLDVWQKGTSDAELVTVVTPF